MRGNALRNFVRGHAVTARPLGELRVTRMLRDPRANDLRRCVALVRPGTMFIDVGASVGDFSLAANRRIGRDGMVLAFEANPEVYQDLVMSTLSARVTALNLAASDRSGWATLQVPHDAHGTTMRARSSLEQHSASSHYSTYRVRTVRIDDLVSDKPIVSAIKIDVEGHELAVLRGAEETLESHRPALVVEIEARHLVGHDISDVVRWLTARGYVAHALDGDRLVPWQDFDVTRDQTQWLREDGPRGVMAGAPYVNNFLFSPGPQ